MSILLIHSIEFYCAYSAVLSCASVTYNRVTTATLSSPVESVAEKESNRKRKLGIRQSERPVREMY